MGTKTHATLGDEMKEKILSVILLFIGGIIFLCSLSLYEWGKEYLNPCCYKMCGVTTSYADCYPNHLCSVFILIAVVLITIGVFNYMYAMEKKP